MGEGNFCKLLLAGKGEMGGNYQAKVLLAKSQTVFMSYRAFSGLRFAFFHFPPLSALGLRHLQPFGVHILFTNKLFKVMSL